MRPRRLFGFPLEPVDGAPCFFTGSIAPRGCGLPSTDSLSGFVSAGNGKIQGGLRSSDGYDAGKKVNGKKRHVLVDTQGLLLHAVVHVADMQDRDVGVLLMSTLFGLFLFLLKLYADSGYQGPKFKAGLTRVCEQVNVEIVKRSDVGKFVILPKRWVVERTIAWLNRCRRLAKDWERLNRNGLTFLRWASIRLMVRKLCKAVD